MFDRFSSVRDVFIRLWLGVFVFWGSACGTVPDSTVTVKPTCISPTPEANPYKYTVEQQLNQQSKVRDIYINSFSNLVEARQSALSQLGKNTEHWSDQVDIANDDANMVRIVITYLDPILIQYIVLNHVLNDTNRISGPMQVEDFNEETNRIMRKLGDRNEMLFLVTITSPFYRAQAYNNVLNVRLPIREMTLINGSGRRVLPSHVDQILDENIKITHGPVSGIVGYPLAEGEQGQCIWLMDPWTNTITLDVSNVFLGENTFKTLFWSIPYRSLIMQDNHYSSPTYDPFFSTPITKLETPPTPNWMPNAQYDNTNWTAYWEAMGKYIWGFVITESHR